MWPFKPVTVQGGERIVEKEVYKDREVVRERVVERPVEIDIHRMIIPANRHTITFTDPDVAELVGVVFSESGSGPMVERRKLFVERRKLFVERYVVTGTEEQAFHWPWWDRERKQWRNSDAGDTWNVTYNRPSQRASVVGKWDVHLSAHPTWEVVISEMITQAHIELWHEALSADIGVRMRTIPPQGITDHVLLGKELPQGLPEYRSLYSREILVIAPLYIERLHTKHEVTLGLTAFLIQHPYLRSIAIHHWHGQIP
jgi:hypothetical protein